MLYTYTYTMKHPSLKLPQVIAILLLALAPIQLTFAGTAYQVYLEQCRALELRMDSLALSVLRQPDASNNASEQEALALLKLIHRLQETLLNESLHSSEKSRILGLAQMCQADDFVLSSIQSFLSTKDMRFLDMVAEGQTLRRSIAKAFLLSSSN